MPKLKLIAEPTFKAKASIPVPGSPSAEVEFIFIHRTKSAFEQWRVANDKDNTKSDIQIVMEMASGWDLDDPFNVESVTTLLSNYHGAAYAISTAYAKELLGARLGN